MKNENEREVKRNAKDSVFCDLFSYPKYQLKLYQALHPEDTETTESDIHTVTLETVIMNAIYNDLGIMVRDRLLILVEAQSSWSVNILIRIILYFAGEWKKYIQDTCQSLYSGGKAKIPKPEFYVIYTGEDKADVRSEYRLADEFFDGDDRFINAKIRVITDGRKGDIISQYVTFTRVLNAQIKEHGRTKEAVRETIRICRDEDALTEYLREREKEVTDIMDILFDQDYNMNILNEEMRTEARAEGRAEGHAEGKAEGRTEGEDARSIQVYNNCLDQGLSEQQAISLSMISDESLAIARSQRQARTDKSLKKD